jgi:hypothetical protein
MKEKKISTTIEKIEDNKYDKKCKYKKKKKKSYKKY